MTIKKAISLVLLLNMAVVPFAAEISAISQLAGMSRVEPETIAPLAQPQLPQLTGAQIAQLSAQARENYLIALCEPLLYKSETQLRDYLGKLRSSDPLKAKQVEQCLDSETSIAPVPASEISDATKRVFLSGPVYNRVDIITIINCLVAVGNVVINVIKGGDIVFNNGYTSVYPDAADWRYFTWKKQALYAFRYTKKALFGKVTVIDSVIALGFKYDGQYQGYGSYIGNIQVVGEKCTTFLSNKISVKAELPPSSVVNLTPATPLNPTAAIDLNLSYTVGGILNNTRVERYQVRGDGKLINRDTGAEIAPAQIIPINQ